MKRVFCPVLGRQEQVGKKLTTWKGKRKYRDQAIKKYIAIHDTLDGFDMDKDYTKDDPQEYVLRGLEEVVQKVESTFHTG